MKAFNWRSRLFGTRRRALGSGCGGLALAGCCLIAAAAALQGPSKPSASPAPTQPVSRSVATAPAEILATATSEPTDAPTQAPTQTKQPSATSSKTASPIPPTETAVPATPTRIRITFTPAPVQPADTATSAPAVVADTPTAAPVVEPPTAPPPAPAAGGYVCANGEACVKGNINSSGDKIYHFPGCGSYNQTKIDEGAGERWFTSSAEAEAAGWRKAGNCP